MRFIGLIILFVSLPALTATKFKTQIEDVDFGKQLGDEVLVFLKTGQVVKLATWDTSLVQKLQDAKKTSKWFTITLDKKRFITGLKPIKSPIKVVTPILMLEPKLQGDYVPTTIADMTLAKQYFREAKHPAKEETQCFNRAIVWTYEWWKKHSLKSNKLLIYFTRNYIRRYDFEWWFHITPSVHVMENGKVVERTMDAKYTHGPLEYRKWSNIFTNRDPECPVITRYSQYADNPYEGECFLQRTYMYTYQPADLQMQEAWGYTKDAFNMNEVNAAYLEAFTAPPIEEGGDDEETEETEGGE